MPFEITDEPDCICARWFGVITEADARRFADEVEAREDAATTMVNRITDITAVERFDIGFPTIFDLAVRRKARHFPNRFKSAVVVREPVQLGLARMFQTLNDNPQIEIHLVHSMEEALEWLGDGGCKGAATPDPGRG